MPRQSQSAIDDQTFHHRRRILWLERDCEREVLEIQQRAADEASEATLLDQRRDVRYAIERRNINNKAAEEELNHFRAKQYLELLHKKRMLEAEREHEREMGMLRRQQLALEKGGECTEGAKQGQDRMATEHYSAAERDLSAEERARIMELISGAGENPFVDEASLVLRRVRST